jgi:ABC-type glycerol-3-phosphate transport system substrate-binding protein
MKRLLTAGISSLAILLAATSAHAQSSIDPATVTGKIVYYTHWTSYLTDGKFDKWKQEFKALYPGVEDVDVQGITTYSETMSTRLATGDYGDVLDTPPTVPRDELPDFFAPLDDTGLVPDFYYTSNWAVDGAHYALPFGVNVEGIVYNKAAFAKAGVEVPKTWTEFLAAAHKIKDAGITPVVTNLASAWPLDVYNGLAVAISGQPDFLDSTVKDPAPFAADKPLGKSLNVLHTIITEGLAEEDLTGDHWEDSKGWLASGKAAMWFLGNWSINQVIQEGSVKAGVAADAGNIGSFPLPYDDSGKYNVNSGPDYGMSVAVNSKNLPTAKAWVDFLLTKSDISQVAGFIPGYKKLEPTLPQLAEIQSHGPTIIEQIPPGPAYANTANLINYSGGHGIQSLMLADDYAAAVAKLNKDWADAASRQ